jgi:hypothetical protein
MKTGRSLLIKLLAIAIFSFIPLVLFSQEASTCAENLKEAQNQFDKGHIELISGLLGECMKSGFKSDEQLSAYKLLIQASLFEDKLGEADSSMLAFLKRYPEYQLSPTDHSSFVYLFNTFRVKPVLQLTLHIGLNLPYISSVTQHSLSGVPKPNKYSTDLLNFFGSLEAKYPVNKKFEVNLEAGISSIKFTKTEDFLNFSQTKYIETQQRIELPVSVTYNIITFGRFTPFVRGGFGAALMLSTSAKASATSFDPTKSDTPQSSADISRSDSRHFINMFAQAGFGIKLKTPRGFASFEARVNPGLGDQVVRGGASEQPLQGIYHIKDDDFNLNTMNLTFGYTYIFYKPSKRK